MRKKNKVLLGTISLLIVFTITISISYAYWRLTYTAEKINKITSSCFSMELTNEKNNIVLDDAYPISDEKGKALTPYSFTITNTCDLFASYTINLEMLEGTTLNSKYIKTMINSEAINNLNDLETTDPSIDGATESRILFTGSLGSGDSVDYTFRVWMDSETPFNEDSMNKIFQAKITVTAEVSTYSPVENGFTNLADALLVNEYQTTSLDVAKNKIASKQKIDFKKTAPIIEWQPLLDTESVSLTILKVDPSMTGSYNINTNAAKILLAKSYTFDSAKGYYYLVEPEYYDPTLVDFDASDYYMCSSNITVTENNSVTYYDAESCATIHKIERLSETSSGTLTLSGGDTIITKRYMFITSISSEIEVESDKSDKGLYKAEDDYGTTYFYRGNVNNNYVKFAGLYWRVIRVNGDKSIRLLYAGHSENAVGTDLIVGVSNYNSTRTNPTYIGYMYSNTLNTSYQDTIKNDNDSTIKIKVDSWYKTNIIDKGYNSYIADSGFCNDRSIASGGGATQNETTFYAPYTRVVDRTPIFTCPNKNNDLFTLVGNSNGNGALTYPVGLMTVDELMASGYSIGYLNKMNYTFSTEGFWSMSPLNFSTGSSAANIWVTFSTGTIGDVFSNNTFGVRPVINLKSTTEITGGIGTKNDPFIIK